jgi:hypothetical protein
VDVSKLTRYLAAPREGHLEQVFHIFAYLKHHPKSQMVFDDHEMVHTMTNFVQCDWSEFYPGAAKAEPPNAPELRGKSVTMTCYVDADHADHAGCQVLIKVNKAMVYIAARIAIEMIEGLRYKLRMMGIEVSGPTAMFCDNESVVKNSTRPAYHRVPEAQAARIVAISHIAGTVNPADAFT